MPAAVPDQNNPQQQKFQKILIFLSVMVAPLITSLAGISWLCSNKTKTLLEHQHLGALFPQEYPWNKNSLQACTDFTQRHHDFKCNSFDLIAKNLCSTWLIVHVCSTQISKGVMQEVHRFIGSAAHGLSDRAQFKSLLNSCTDMGGATQLENLCPSTLSLLLV